VEVSSQFLIPVTHKGRAHNTHYKGAEGCSRASLDKGEEINLLNPSSPTVQTVVYCYIDKAIPVPTLKQNAPNYYLIKKYTYFDI
jgi:hypothetical protein